MTTKQRRRAPTWTEKGALRRTKTSIARIRKQIEAIAYEWFDQIDMISAGADDLGRLLTEFEESLDETVKETLADRKAAEAEWS
jgi:hypothetical protein